MKVAKKSPRKKPPVATSGRATLTVSRDIYGKIERLRGSESRSAWIKRLVDEEEQRRKRVRLADTLRQEYSAAVCRETVRANDDYPIHDA